MSEVKISRTNVLLTAALVVTLVAAALLLGMLLGRSSTPPGNSESSAAPIAPTTIADPSSAEATPDPTPVAQLSDGSELPGLLAAIVECGDSEKMVLSFAQFRPGTADVKPRFSPDTLEFSSASAGDISLLGINDPLVGLKCALGVLGAPPGVVQRMGETRAIDGTLSENWPGYVVTWTYHPDQGLVAVFSYDK